MRQRAGAPRWRAAESREAGFPPKQPAPDMLRARGGGIPGSQMSVLGARGGEARADERRGERRRLRISRSVEIYYNDALFYVKNNLCEKIWHPLGGHYLKRHRGRAERYLRQLRPLP